MATPTPEHVARFIRIHGYARLRVAMRASRRDLTKAGYTPAEIEQTLEQSFGTATLKHLQNT